MIAEGLIIGLNLFSLHAPANPDLTGLNPGTYIRTPSGWGAGAYRNSHHRLSLHLDYTWALPHQFSLTAGLVSGYQYHATPDGTWSDGSRGALVPFVGLSYALPPWGAFTPHLTLLPNVGHKASSVFHFSLERTFP